MGGLDSNSNVTIEGQKPLPGDDAHARWAMVGPSFFSTTGIPILEGREITDGDSGNGQRVGVINQTMARKFFPHSNPIGQRVFVHTEPGEAPFVIVGVVQDSKQHGAKRSHFRASMFLISTLSASTGQRGLRSSFARLAILPRSRPRFAVW
jgi:hypothetical protein